MQERLSSIKEDNSNISSKKSLISYLIPSNNKEFLTQHKTDLDLVNTKKTIIRDINPQKIIFTVISSVFISISIYFPSYIHYLYSENFDTNIFLLFHSLSIIILIPIITYLYEKTNALSTLNYIEHKRWFFLRANLNYLGMIFYIFSLKFVRCITIQISLISMISIIFLLGVYFYKRGNISQNLVFGMFCILTGDSIVLSNELKHVNNNGIYYNTIGLIFVFISFTSFAGIKIINIKYLNLDNYNLLIHMLYNNIVIFSYCLIVFPISFFKGINICFNFFILTLLSGFVFVIGIFMLVLVLQKKQSVDSRINTIGILNKPKLDKILLCVYNLNIFYVFILCFYFGSEELFFKDFVASIIVFLFKVFNSDKERKVYP